MNTDAEIQKVINAADTSAWLRRALQAAVERDPADAANDAEYLSELLARRFNAIMNVGPEHLTRPTHTWNVDIARAVIDHASPDTQFQVVEDVSFLHVEQPGQPG